jgi:2-haloacid dehalogenase
MLDWKQFDWISFDCYGTLIDWETGILGYMGPLIRGKGRTISDDQILNLYSEFEPREQSGNYRTYREVLAHVVRDFANHLDLTVSQADMAGLAESVRHWKPFEDTVAGLEKLKLRYKLAILSNIDDDLFAMTATHLRVVFDAVVTAQQAGAYKPSHRNFELLLSRIGAPKNKLLHAAESLYHDVVPARKLGIATVWVNRRQGKPAAATKLAQTKADVEVASIGELAKLAVQ